jgi:predicted glycosyltransferase
MVPQLWRHLAACDLAVLQGGGTTTLEVEALRVPFLFFPVEHHSEQEVTVAGRLSRHGAGVRMHVSSTSPQGLADAIAANLGAKVSYPEIPVEGARLAARRVLERAGVRGLSPLPEARGALDGGRADVHRTHDAVRSRSTVNTTRSAAPDPRLC